MPIRARIAGLCNGAAIIGDTTMLTARGDEAKALRVAVEHFVDLHDRLEHARVLAAEAGKASLVTTLDLHLQMLRHTFNGSEDQVVAWATILPAREQQLFVVAAVPALAGNADPVADAALSWLREEELIDPLQAVAVTAQADEEPATEGDGRKRPSPGRRRAPRTPPWSAPLWRDHFRGIERLIGVLSFLIITGTGMSILYVPNKTFGSAGDYLSMILWGSTATAALALARRLLPGALTSQQGI